MANLTKRQLSASLQKMLTQNQLDKITIQDLVNEAQVSRKTFYYHFQDIYDLLEWTLVEEGKKLLVEGRGEDGWKNNLWNVFRYLHQHQAAIVNIYRSQKDGGLLRRHVASLILPLLEQDFDSQPGHERVAPEDREFLLDLYSHGIVEFFYRWIGDGMKPEPEQTMARLSRLFEGSMGDFIQRYNRTAAAPPQ